MQRNFLLPGNLDMNSVYVDQSLPFDDKFNDFIHDIQVDGGIQTCIKNKHKFTINKNNLDRMIHDWGRNPGIRTQNMFYFYPNMDEYYGTSDNYPLGKKFNNKLENNFSIRLDHRVGNMVVISSYNMLVIDFDVKDFYPEVFTPEQKISTYLIIKNTLKRICEIGKAHGYKFVWHLSESDKGFHAFLINQYVNCNDPKWLYFMLAFCGDVLYVGFTNFHGWCVRLSKKTGREKDYVAKQSTDISTIILPDSSQQNISLVYLDPEDLNEIKPDLLKLIKFKYHLIKYFGFFTDIHADYILSFYKGKSMVTIIREQLEDIYNKIDSINITDPQFGEKMIFQYLNNFKVSQSEIDLMHQQIQTQLEDDGRVKVQTLPKKLIEEISPTDSRVKKYIINYE